jgi:hypothetical protein
MCMYMCKKMYWYGLKFVTKENELERGLICFLSFGKNVFDVWFTVRIIFKMQIMCWGMHR